MHKTAGYSEVRWWWSPNNKGYSEEILAFWIKPLNIRQNKLNVKRLLRNNQLFIKVLLMAHHSNVKANPM